MRLPFLCLSILLVAGSFCHAAPDEGNGEVRLYIRAAYTGHYAWDVKSRGAGEDASTTTQRVRDRVTLLFEGTSSWRLEDWDAGEVTHNCRVSADGGGSWLQVERGKTPCFHHPNSPFTTTTSGKWEYQVPAETKGLGPNLGPAGTVVINPLGQWFLILGAFPNPNEAEPRGSWSRSHKACCSNWQERHPIDRENSIPPSPHGLFGAKDAYHDTLGGGGKYQEPIMGSWDVDKKGFFASGHLHNRGGAGSQPVGTPPSGVPDNGYSYGTSNSYWTADIFYTISYTMTPPPVECIIETDGEYANWIPEGGANEQTVGNRLGISARLQVKGKPDKTPLQKGQFTFQLVESSSEPGVALNWPLKDAKDDPDLKFQQSGGIEIKDAGKTAQTIGKELQSASAELGCYDNGAYGKVRVICRLTDGSIVYGHLEGQPGKEELLIPRDENRNRVADGWENGRSGAASDDKEDTPALDGVAGDGLSLCEEYRGLIHQGKPLRLDPARKDLVIANEMGERAKAGLSLFESASGIHVIELSRGELPEDGVVNTNSRFANNGAQYGLRLVSGKLSEGIVGISLPDRVKASPADCERMVINSDLSFLSGASRNDVLAMSIAHEIGHSLGVKHHGDSGPGTTYENLTINNANVKIFGVDGVEITLRPYTLEGLIETKSNGGESSGAEDCMMRNSSYFQWVKRVNRMGEAAYYAVPPSPIGRSFCEVTAGSGLNAAENKPVSYFGNSAAGRGACTTHLRVKDQ